MFSFPIVAIADYCALDGLHQHTLAMFKSKMGQQDCTVSGVCKGKYVSLTNPVFRSHFHAYVSFFHFQSFHFAAIIIFFFPDFDPPNSPSKDPFDNIKSTWTIPPFKFINVIASYKVFFTLKVIYSQGPEIRKWT